MDKQPGNVYFKIQNINDYWDLLIYYAREYMSAIFNMNTAILPQGNDL